MNDGLRFVDSSWEKVARAEVLIDARRAAEAIPLLQQAIRENPHSVTARCLLGLALLQENRVDAALRAAEEAVACDPGEEWAHRLRAVILLDKKQARKALASMREAVRLEPASPQVLEVLVRCLLANRKRQEARQSAEHLLQLAPAWSDAHEALGLVALEERKWQEAEQHYRAALELNPQSWTAMNNLGLALQVQLRYKEAIELFHTAARLNPAEETARRNLLGSLQNYLGGGLVGFWVLLQALHLALRAVDAAAPEHQPILAGGLVLLLAIAIGVGIGWRKKRLAEMHPTVAAFYEDERRRSRRDTYRKLRVVGGLGAGTITVAVWSLCAWIYGAEKMGLTGLGAGLFGTTAAATLVGYVYVARNWKEISAGWQ